jgi:hypothetical protein
MELKALFEAVSVQAALLEQLLELLEREVSELSNVKIDAITRTNLEKEELIGKISRHSSVLQREIAEVAAVKGLPSNASLGVIAKHFAQKGQKQLHEKQNSLKKTANKVKRAATMNREIAERFSSMISTSLNLITRLLNQSNVYGAKGGFQRCPPTGAVMINREA